MLLKKILILVFVFHFLAVANAQEIKTDSAKVAATFQTLLSLCKNVDFADPETTKQGAFYKASAFIIYRGNDENRSWKDFANYRNAEEKKGVDEVCFRINESVNRDSSYKIEKYFTEKESEGIWHVLQVSYMKKGIEKKAAFAFLKISDRFGLGDID